MSFRLYSNAILVPGQCNIVSTTALLSIVAHLKGGSSHYDKFQIKNEVIYQ